MKTTLGQINKPTLSSSGPSGFKTHDGRDFMPVVNVGLRKARNLRNDLMPEFNAGRTQSTAASVNEEYDKIRSKQPTEKIPTRFSRTGTIRGSK